MSNRAAHEPIPDSTSVVRPLPPRPNLEFERKQAKHLLRQLRRGDAGALKRSRALHRGGGPASHSDFRLADAQFTIAREYGFPSWPRLVEYFTTWDRHDRSPREAQHARESYEFRVQSILAGHRDRRESAGRFLATVVPRFYGRSVEEVFASTVSVDDARLVVACQSRFPSWEALMKAAETFPRDAWKHYDSPHAKALNAVRRCDLASLQRIVEAHPELVRPRGPDERIDALVYGAVWHERASRAPEARRITDWIVSQGFDLTKTLNLMLLSALHTTTEDVAFLLERGADPAWTAPNGIPVLEHALYRYWNSEAVDLIACRVVPRKAFWIAAGLGDVQSLDRYVDRKGVPTTAARRHRPDFTAIGPGVSMSLPEPDDLEIVWEAFMVAGLNCRFAVLDALLERGFPIDYSALGSSLLQVAVDNRLVPLVEFLVKRGANLDLKRPGSSGTARQSAEWHYQDAPASLDTRRILELCGGRDPETVMQSYQEKRTKPIQFAPKLRDTLELAREEAVRLGQSEIHLDNLFVAILRDESGGCLHTLSAAGVDLGQLRRSIEHRLVPAVTAASQRGAPYSTEASAVLQMASAEAEARGREYVTTLHLLYSLVSSESGPVADLLKAAGSTPEQVRETCATSL